MNLFLPDIGTLLRLDADWTFTLYSEYRNATLFDSLGIPTSERKNKIVELPKGLIIKVDRIYIRKGLSQYSSLTFGIPTPKTKKDKEEMPQNIIFGGSKFWVKLHECNGILVSPVIKNSETSDLFKKLYHDIEKDASSKFGVEKCTKLLAQINKLLGDGNNINNLSTHMRYDQFLISIIEKIKNDDFLSDHLSTWLKTEMRDYKIKQLI